MCWWNWTEVLILVLIIHVTFVLAIYVVGDIAANAYICLPNINKNNQTQNSFFNSTEYLKILNK